MAENKKKLYSKMQKCLEEIRDSGGDLESFNYCSSKNNCETCEFLSQCTEDLLEELKEQLSNEN